MSVDKFFGRGGAISKMLSGYVPRPGQVAMAQAVEQALSDRRHLLVDAPTGTGKSLAYSIPAAVKAVENRDVTVICTSNITLQEQLFNKDLPFVQKVVEKTMGEEFKYCLLKGMGNFLCKIKYGEVSGSKDIPDYVHDWAKVTRDGDRSGMTQEPHPKVWSQICASSEDCISSNCPHFDDGCFPRRLRRSAQSADIIVTNYHYLFADISSKGFDNPLIPEYNTIIMDEAHNAPGIAMDFHGWVLTHWKVRRVCNRARMSQDPTGERVEKAVIAASTSFFGSLDSRANRFISQPLDIDSLHNALSGLIDFYKKEGAEYEDTVFKARYMMLRNSCKTIQAHLEEVRDLDANGVVYFIEAGRTEGLQEIHCKAVDTADYFLRSVLPGNTLIGTSATMTTGRNFRYLANQMGLKPDSYSSLMAPSPFEGSKTLVMIPRGFPVPSSPDHTLCVAKAILDISSQIGGRIMGLFTSNRALNTSRDYLLGKSDLNILYQGQMPKTKLIERFKQEPENSILLATASFWEGVDIPGRALTCVVIDKLPFARPDDPVSHYIEKKGGNPFIEYSIPQAMIKLKQGVGRLIRTEKDYGAVAVMDPRIHVKSYGDTVLASLPEDCMLGDEVEDIIQFIMEKEKEDGNTISKV